MQSGHAICMLDAKQYSISRKNAIDDAIMYMLSKNVIQLC
jgi:hypothetical protein